MRVAVVTDSNSGITQAEAKELGIYVIPMPFMINGEVYEEDINLTQEQFYEKLEDGADISTSQPSPEAVMELWDEVLKEYDEIVHIPMSSALSGSCQTAMMLAEDYDGKVQVVNNQRISVTQYQSAMDAKALAEGGLDAARIREVLERTKLESSIYVTVDTLKYLKKGGRITPAAAALGTLLRIKPVLQIQGEKLDSFSKARTMKQAKSTMMAAIAHDFEERFHAPDGEGMWLEIAHTQNHEAARELEEELRELYPKCGEIRVDPLSLSVACHIGPGALAIACVKKLDMEAECRKEK
ncbi:MAG: DegV family protein [Eubacteriales bacterium]|nr:DegV family protein [Eubacteriales bacterium]